MIDAVNLIHCWMTEFRDVGTRKQTASKITRHTNWAKAIENLGIALMILAGAYLIIFLLFPTIPSESPMNTGVSGIKKPTPCGMWVCLLVARRGFPQPFISLRFRRFYSTDVPDDVPSQRVNSSDSE